MIASGLSIVVTVFPVPILLLFSDKWITFQLSDFSVVEPVMTQVRIKQKGQVTIPAALRERTGLKEGDWLEAKIHEGSILLIPVPAHSRPTYTLPRGGADITPYIGAAKGVFATPAEADAFIHAERKRWT